LYDLELEKFGLPAFDDWLPVGDGSADRVLPVPTIEMRGPVVKGFGRGSTQLGIPTANLDIVPLKHQVDSLAPGIYLGFASIRGETHKMVMSIGWNPYFDNSKKTIEPWLLHEFESDFYGEELSLVVVGYIRPEADFTTLEALVERIHRDAEVARVVLEREPFVGKRQMLMP
jgi:riboflavin kinase